jgi:sugar phosphate isomerase/epimerase
MITRRAFTASAAASCCLPLISAERLNLGIGTYTYHSLSLDDMIIQLKKLGISQIEMSRGEFMLFSKPPAERFQAVKSKFDSAGIQCVSYYTATI